MSGIWRDETGHLSAARVFFSIWTMIIVWAAWHEPADAFWPLATAVMMGLLSWTAGPRIAKYFAPQAGAAAKAAADAVRKRFDNAYTDDERGEHKNRERV
jgi:hypothetical protein